MSGRRVLVTGGAGFIGSHVVDRLVSDGCEVFVVDDLSTGSRVNVNPAALLEVVDIRDPGLATLIKRHRPDAVVHLAAQAAVSRSVNEPAFDAAVNVMGTINLLEACRRQSVGSIVYVSTGGAAYGETDRVPTPEEHPTRPTSPYGVSKVAAEMYVECFRRLTNGRAVTLRLANVYGPRQQPEGEAGVVAIFSHRLLTGEPCTIFGDGEQTRDYVYVADVADAVARALSASDSGVFNVGTSRETSVNTLYRLVSDAIGVVAAPRYAAARPGEVIRSALAATQARERLGWTPRTSLDVGLAATVRSMRASV